MATSAEKLYFASSITSTTICIQSLGKIIYDINEEIVQNRPISKDLVLSEGLCHMGSVDAPFETMREFQKNLY